MIVARVPATLATIPAQASKFQLLARALVTLRCISSWPGFLLLNRICS
jgi:hypothetical protein